MFLDSIDFGDLEIKGARSIKVIEKEHGKILEKTVTISDYQTFQGVNHRIEFDVNSYSVRPDSYPFLDKIGWEIKKALTFGELKGKHIVIIGHTDSDENETKNLNLSLDRALSVRSYLTSNSSIPSPQIRAIGYGDSVPLVPNTSNANKQLNRRVEIVTMP